MKIRGLTKFLFAILVILCMLVGRIYAGTTLVFGSPAIVNNTTSNLLAGSIGQSAIPSFTMNVQSYGLTATTACTFNLCISYVTNNITNSAIIATYMLPSTNAGVYSLQPAPGPQATQLFIQEITTNNVTNYVWISQ